MKIPGNLSASRQVFCFPAFVQVASLVASHSCTVTLPLNSQHILKEVRCYSLVIRHCRIQPSLN